MNAKVSFVVPTLNRGRYVVRAVDSCLAAKTIETDVEVVVLDSMSDDGSWELLNERFGDDPRVILAQNERGLGPTHSWLDGARLITGDYVTFLWSDDYVCKDFLRILLPPLLDGCVSAFGTGLIRDIDDNSPLPMLAGATKRIRGLDLLEHHLGLISGIDLPVSPAVALFTRAVFECWIVEVEDWCLRPGVYYKIMWRRAIGPDLMLFLAASTCATQQVSVHRRAVAQFSSHPGSITIASSRTPLRVGYWLAKWWAVRSLIADDTKSSIKCAAQLTLSGLLIYIRARSTATSGLDAVTLSEFKGEVDEAWKRLIKIAGPVHGVAVLAWSAGRLTWKAVVLRIGWSQKLV